MDCSGVDGGALYGADPTVEGGESEMEVLAWVSELVLKRVSPHFPAAVPSVKPTPAIADALVLYNLQVCTAAIQHPRAYSMQYKPQGS